MQKNRLGVAFAAVALAAAACCAQAQNVKLRLANSLCTSMTGQVLTSQQVPPLASGAKADASVNAQLASRLEQQQAQYFSRLDAIVPFSGLYLSGQADQSFSAGSGRYAFGLEWELFDQGRADARRQLERLRLENKAQYLQLLRDIEQRQLQENLLAIEQMRGKLLATLYEREAAAIRPVLERRRQELAVGRATKGEVAEIEYKAERAALRRAHYAGATDVLVYPQAQDLINRIESVVLRGDGELLERALARSADAQLHTLQAARGEFLPSVKDNLSVRLYLERGKEFERSPHNIAGVRVRVPLGQDTGRAEAVEATRGLYADQHESLKAALSQKLALLAGRLRLKQNDMRLLQAENQMLRKKSELACWRLDFPVATIASDPDRDVEELTLLLHEKQREILSARLDVLEVLTQLSALVKPQRPEELYSLSPQ